MSNLTVGAFTSFSLIPLFQQPTPTAKNKPKWNTAANIRRKKSAQPIEAKALAMEIRRQILPVPCATIAPGELGISFDDCSEEALEPLSMYFNVDHLSECTNVDLFKYPMAGVVYGIGNRFVVPLKVQTTPKSTPLVVYFVVDSGAPLTSFGTKTCEKLFGNKQPSSVTIQETRVQCRRSGEFTMAMKDVNLLAFPPLEKPDESLTSDSHTSASDQKMPSHHGSTMDLN
ncbi:hypothetical protein M3Y96_00412400 [Aphelenchoides besseyi]|nr:hypothetical protein M3Y96_00412400 [Aphelenchoides besseyi]